MPMIQSLLSLTWSGSFRLPGVAGICWSSWRNRWLSRVSCEECFDSRSFSSISSLFRAVNFAFTVTSRDDSFRCFSRHLHTNIFPWEQKWDLQEMGIISCTQFRSWLDMQHRPSILKPDFDLLGLNVGKDRTILDELLAAYRAWFGTFMVYPLQSLHLLVCISHIFSRHIHARIFLHCLQISVASGTWFKAHFSSVRLRKRAINNFKRSI